MTIETRRVGAGEVRVVDQAEGIIEARVLTYGTVDDYGTIWEPGCFADSLAARMPIIAWAHDWSDPIGRWTNVTRDDGTALELQGRLDVGADVPRARQALAQFRSGTLDQFSVGFTRQDWTALSSEQQADLPAGARETMQRALLDEASPVLVGAVKGTGLLAVRRKGHRGLDLDAVVELGRRVNAGTLTLEDATAALNLLDVPAAQTPRVTDAPAEQPPAEPVTDEQAEEIDAALAEAAEALT